MSDPLTDRFGSIAPISSGALIGRSSMPKTSISLEVEAPNSLTEFAQGGAILKTIS
jgi:hypothetical protein